MLLPRGGVITGMVLDERGEPAIGAFVRAMRFTLGRAAAATADGRRQHRRSRHLSPPLAAAGGIRHVRDVRGSGPQNDAQRIQMEMECVRRSMRARRRRCPPADGGAPGGAAGAAAGADRAGDGYAASVFRGRRRHRRRRWRSLPGRADWHRPPDADHPGGPHRGPRRRAGGSAAQHPARAGRTPTRR